MAQRTTNIEIYYNHCIKIYYNFTYIYMEKLTKKTEFNDYKSKQTKNS